MQYWLMKSEPEAYSITMLATDDAGRWDGVRNYQARNFLRSMRVGDRVIFITRMPSLQPGRWGRWR